MKHCKFLPALLVLLTVATGCDTIRTLLGKPTSEDIENARLAQEAAEKARQDSIALAQALAEQAAEAAKVIPICRYNVIVGAFAEAANADNFAAKLEQKGETVLKINFKNGLTGISVLNTDDFNAACRKLKATHSTDDVPYDCWIYDATTARHK